MPGSPTELREWSAPAFVPLRWLAAEALLGEGRVGPQPDLVALADPAGLEGLAGVLSPRPAGGPLPHFPDAMALRRHVLEGSA